jgi:hypothetical protein
MVPWRNVPHQTVFMAITAAVLSTCLLLRGRLAPTVQIAAVLFMMWLTGALAVDEMRSAAKAVPTSFRSDPRWVDSRVGGQPVAIVWRENPSWSSKTLRYRQHSIFDAEFFNRSLKDVFFVGQPMQYELPQTRLRRVDGRLTAPSHRGQPKAYSYALATSTLRLAGSVVGHDAKAGLVLYRLDRPLRLGAQ